MKKCILALAFVIIAAPVFAQAPPATPPATPPTVSAPPAPAAPAVPVAPAKAPSFPTVSDADQQAFNAAALDTQVWAVARNAMQEKLDVANANFQRLLNSLKKDGYDLTQDPTTKRLIYVIAKPTK